MASFQAIIGWKWMSKGENKNYRSVSFLPYASQIIPKKQPKNFKKLKNTIMDSFSAKICWKRLKKREKKNSCSVPFQPIA